MPLTLDELELQMVDSRNAALKIPAGKSFQKLAAAKFETITSRSFDLPKLHNE